MRQPRPQEWQHACAACVKDGCHLGREVLVERREDVSQCVRLERHAVLHCGPEALVGVVGEARLDEVEGVRALLCVRLLLELRKVSHTDDADQFVLVVQAQQRHTTTTRSSRGAQRFGDSYGGRALVR